MSQFVEGLTAGSVEDVVRTAAMLGIEEMRARVAGLSLKEAAKLRDWAFAKLSNHQVDSALIIGALLELLQALAEESDREVLLSVANELGISETKAYDSKAVFRNFGRALVKEPELAKAFSLEALKQLSSGSATQSARDAAAEEARDGCRITAKRAKEIVRENAAPDAGVAARSLSKSNDQTPADSSDTTEVPEIDSPEAADETTATTSSADPVLRYQGKAAIVTVMANDDSDQPDYEQIERDLRAALDEFCGQAVLNLALTSNAETMSHV